MNNDKLKLHKKEGILQLDNAICYYWRFLGKCQLLYFPVDKADQTVSMKMSNSNVRLLAVICVRKDGYE